MKTFFIALLTALVLSSCASYNARIVGKTKDKIAKNDLNRLNGTYALYSYKGFKKNGQPYKESQLRNSSSLYNYISKKELEIDSMSKYTVTIKATGLNILSFEIQRDELPIERFEVSGKMRRNGFFHLGNQKKGCEGIPYILGGCYQSKSRLGLTKGGDLLVQNAVDNSGAILIVLAAGYSFNKAYAYQRI